MLLVKVPHPKSFMQQLMGCQIGHSGTRWVMDQNEVSIHLHAHNHANLQETEKLHLENKTTFNLEYWLSARKGDV